MNLLKRTMVMLPLVVMVVIVWVRVTLTYTAEDLEAEINNSTLTLSDDYDDSGGGNQTADSLILTALMPGNAGEAADS